MSDLHLLQGMGEARGMDAGQNANFTRVMAAQYDTTEQFKKEVANKKLGRPEMLDYESGNGFGKVYLTGSYFTQDDTKANFSTPEKAYTYLDSVTKGANALFKPNKQQLEKASGVLKTFDTPEKVKQIQTALGVTVDGIVGEDTTRAAANYLTVFSEKEFKAKANGVLSASQNYPVILNFIKSLETTEATKADDVEGKLHIGQETQNEYNNNKAGIANTTRYGVIQIDYKDANGKVQKGFPKKEGESDIDHATRYFKFKFEPQVKAVKGIEKEPQEIVNAVASIAWNLGSIPSNFDLSDESKTRASLLNVTTTGGKHSTGVVNRYVQAYERIGSVKGWSKVDSVKTIADSKDATKFNLEFYDVSGKLLYKDSSVTTAAEKSSIKPNYNYKVVNGALDTKNATLLAATLKEKKT